MIALLLMIQLVPKIALAMFNFSGCHNRKIHQEALMILHYFIANNLQLH